MSESRSVWRPMAADRHGSRQWNREISRAIEQHDVDTLLHAVRHHKTSSALYLNQAIHALGEAGDRRAIEPISGYLSAPQAKVRWAAAAALGKLGDTSVCDAVAQLTDDADHVVREAAYGALIALECSGIAPLLRRGLSDSNRHVRGAAAMALAEMGDTTSLRALRASWRIEPRFSSTRAQLAQAITNLERSQPPNDD
jgi:HEAT repeat protein